MLSRNVRVPDKGPYSRHDIDAQLERLQKGNPIVQHPLNIGRDEDNLLVGYSVETLSENEQDSYAGVLENATVSESECILNARKPLVDYSDVKVVVGKSLTLDVVDIISINVV